jgi:glycerate-2-kinase
MAVTMTLVSESGDTHTLQNDLRICLVSTFCQALLSLPKKKKKPKEIRTLHIELLQQSANIQN